MINIFKKHTTKQIGDVGEEYAVKFLKKNKYKIRERNFRKPYGEIDIIAENKEYIVFVEVKTRQQNSLTRGTDAVDCKKQQKIIKTALAYISDKNNCDIKKSCRFDVCEVYVDKENLSLCSMKYYENAFQTEGYHAFY